MVLTGDVAIMAGQLVDLLADEPLPLQGDVHACTGG